jgi:hypothetical chaperone protein
MALICGLDFGTSNSTIGVSLNGQAHLAPLESNEPRLRSAIFYHTEAKQLIFGERAIAEYLQGEPGRLMMSLKSLLGSSLLNDETLIGERLVPFTEIIGQFIGYLKQQAEQFANDEITHVVVGRPVVFHADPERDILAQNTLEDIVRRQGFQEVAFQYEPLAAGFAYENGLNQEELVLVIDMGGGTSDFSIIQLGGPKNRSNRDADILANHGIRIAGTDFDRRFSLSAVMPLLGMHSLMRGSSSDIHVPDAVYHELTSWHLLRKLYTSQVINDVKRIFQAAYEKPLIQRLLSVLLKQEGHRILNEIEINKKQLSEATATQLNLDFIEEHLSIAVSRQQFNAMISEQREKLIAAILETVHQASISPAKIQSIFYTGGTTRVPVVREDIEKLFPNAKIIQGDIFGSVGLGLTLDAMQKWT